MAAYKKLKREDSYLTTYVAHKSFTVSGSQHDDLGVETYIGISGSGAWLPSGSDSRLVGTDFEHDTRLVYNSIHHLYYSGYDSTGLPSTGSDSVSGSAYENYLQSSYTAYQRRAQEDFTVISIPRELFGTHIKPGSVRLHPAEIISSSNYAFDSNNPSDEFVSQSFIDTIGTVYGGTQVLQDGDYVENEGNYINELAEEFVTPGFDDYSTVLIDDKNGNLILSASNPQRIVGNVIYSHGMIVITNPQVGAYYSYYFSGSLSWQSSHPIYTYNYHCPIKENEFNFSSNPSSIKNGTSGSIADNITGSYFKPYFTTVGLYNDAHELVAVGKLAQPTPVSDNNETTVVVKLDM